jgi:hypothetical protein
MISKCMPLNSKVITNKTDKMKRFNKANEMK